MELARIDCFTKSCPADESAADLRVAAGLAAAAAGDADACLELGLAYCAGSHAVAADLVEAHKWLNLAAMAGNRQAAGLRAEISEEMTAREIAEAQRRARQWIASGQLSAA